MQNFCLEFKILNGDEDFSPTYQYIRCNMIFDFKMADFWRNELFVNGSYTTDTSRAIT
jgi:hypothetical protein